MIELASSVLAGAFVEVAAAATVGNALNGIIGNRADAAFVRSVRAISAGFRSLAGEEDPRNAEIIIQSIHAAFHRSFTYFLETLSSQARDIADRMIVIDLQNMSSIKTYSRDNAHPTGIADAVRPTLASLANSNIDYDAKATANLIDAVTAWCELSTDPLPDHFRVLMTGRAPNGRLAWIEAFRSELANEIINNSAYERLLLVSNVSSIGESTFAIHKIASSLRTDLANVAGAVGIVNDTVGQLVHIQNEQLSYLRRLRSLLPPVESASGHDAAIRVLRACMFGQSGQLIPAGFIIFSAFAGYNGLEQLSREQRLALLREVHTRLIEVLGDDAYISRFDGGEFDIVIRNLSYNFPLERICSNLIKEFLRSISIEQFSVNLTPKIGASASPDHGFSPESLQRNADFALRHALPYGADDFVIYRSEIRTDANHRTLLERDIKIAMRNGDFDLVYQPIIELEKGSIVGFEALVRWIHPTRGIVSPADFIPLAEEMGIILDLSEFVIRTACIEALHWPRTMRLAVNISPSHFNLQRLTIFLAETLESSGLSPERLELEMTEGIFLNEGDVNRNAFDSLKTMGVRIAMDDFGTGYSSLSYLRHTPLDVIKIDRSFVHGIGDPKSSDASIVSTIVMLANTMGMKVTAEGIETAEQAVAAQKLGCTFGQGFFFSKPVKAGEARMIARDASLHHVRSDLFGNPPHGEQEHWP